MKVEVELTTFFSNGDEDRFFSALNGLDCVKNVRGVGRGICFDLMISRLTKEKLFELIALFWRYQINVAFIDHLAENAKYTWLLDKKCYWRSDFGRTKLKLKRRKANAPI